LFESHRNSNVNISSEDIAVMLFILESSQVPTGHGCYESVLAGLTCTPRGSELGRWWNDEWRGKR